MSFNVQAKLSQKLLILFQLIGERLRIIWISKKKEEVGASVKLIADCLQYNFTKQEKLASLIGLAVIAFVFYFSFEFFTFSPIDEAIRNQQSARAESLIQQRLFFMPGNNGLKLRLAHAYLALDRVSEAKSIVELVQAKNPNESYLPKVAIDLAQTLKRNDQSYRALTILEKLPPHSCKTCREEMLELYTIEGRKALMGRNLERANYFLTRALKLAEKSHETTSSLNHRKHELARAYNLHASELIKAKENDRAITILEESKKIFPIAQTYLMLAKLYYSRQANPDDLKKALDCYEKAYSFGATEVEVDYKQTVAKLKQSMKQEGLSSKEIEQQTKKFTLEDKPQIQQNDTSKEDKELPKETPEKANSTNAKEEKEILALTEPTDAPKVTPSPVVKKPTSNIAKIKDSAPLQMDDQPDEDIGLE